MSESQTLTIKDEVIAMLNTLPSDCTLEDIQYHIYVIEKIKKGMERAEKEGTISNEEADMRLKKWFIE